MMEKSADPNTLSRRDILKLAGLSSVGLVAGGLWPPLNVLAAGQPAGQTRDAAFTPDLDIALSAEPSEIPILTGDSTQVWRYRAEVIQGDTDRVREIPGSYLGPIICVQRGEHVRIRYRNAIPQPSIVHWHGLHVPASMDGHPRYVVSPGESYLYEFEVKNRAGTYWYHPHPHGKTGPQVYRGLAGLFLVSDAIEQSLELPSGAHDVPLVIQDRSFDQDNQLVYTSGRPMEQMTGFFGDRILINGQPDYVLPVSTRAYRLRLLNGSNARTYRLAWDDGRPLTIIGTDGGLVERPVERQYAFLGPGERLEVWVDFGSHPVGYEAALVSLPFDPGRAGRGMIGRGRSKGQPLPNGGGASLFKIQVTQRELSTDRLPQKLTDLPPLRPDTADNADNPKQFHLTMRHMQWSINGRVFQMEAVAEDEVVRLGASELWEFHNTGGGMMHMGDMPHPIHLHGKQFRVLARAGVRHNGYMDDGWKDTVLLMPGERVRIQVDFDDYAGLFLYHCHNLEHEDMGMMRNYYVSSNPRAAV
jgi:FtsP/CotA-like multicopper oxidase with cupredoxin domain